MVVLFEQNIKTNNGAALLSDTLMDYPLNVESSELVGEVKAKTFSQDFDEQLDIAEQLYGHHIQFYFNSAEVDSLLSNELFYPKDIKNRVSDVLMMQRRKYQYLF
ncbi:MAG: hypothetical protein K2M91_08730 [Lachnospiraceae bacterium]|nr:hypothetical protein [Lachnospiraceae bacterium]